MRGHEGERVKERQGANGKRRRRGGRSDVDGVSE